MGKAAVHVHAMTAKSSCHSTLHLSSTCSLFEDHAVHRGCCEKTQKAVWGAEFSCGVTT